MSALELLISESQERMLIALRPGFEEQAKKILAQYDLDFAQIGHTCHGNSFRVCQQGKIVVDLPISLLTYEAPCYDRPCLMPQPAGWRNPAPITSVENWGVENWGKVILQMLETPALCSRRWIWEQYDHIIQNNTVLRPGADAGVLRLPPLGGQKTVTGLAVVCDSTPRYCLADPYEGGKQAVVEAWRNLICVGATPLAITNNLNFGNPEQPPDYGAIQGLSCRHGRGMPVFDLSGGVRQCIFLQ